MRKLLTISVFVSLLLFLTACPGPTTKAPKLEITSQAATIKLTGVYTLTGTIEFDGEGDLTYKIGTAEAQKLTVTDKKFTQELKGADLKAGEHTITVTAKAAGHDPVNKTVKVTVEAAAAQ